MKTTFALLGLALIAGFLFFQRPTSALRRENKQLLAQAAEVKRLTQENEQIDRLRAGNKDIARLREENRDLHKLRDDVRRLREQTKDLPSLQAENQRLKASQASTQTAGSRRAPEPLAVIPLNQLAYAGQATPEGSIQTLFWAMRESNPTAIARCLLPEALKDFGAQNEESMRRMAEEMKKKFKSLRILARKEVAADEVLMAVQLEVEGGQVEGAGAFPVKRVGGEWQVGAPK